MSHITEEDFQKMLSNMSEEERNETLKGSGLTAIEAKESWLEAAFPVLLKQHFPTIASGLIDWMKSEIKFSKSRNWRLDFGWHYIGLYPVFIAIELHGLFAKDGSAGRHLRPKGYSEDRVKMNEAALAGWLVLEITDKQLSEGLVFDQILRAFEFRGLSKDEMEKRFNG